MAGLGIPRDIPSAYADGQHTVRDRLHGFTGRTATGQRVIYTLPPQRVDDAATCTLGHEIMHIALGEYHK